MSIAERQLQLIKKYSIIEDPQERLAAIISKGKKYPRPAEDERIDANLVQGCMSKVWLACTKENGHCHYRMDADSPLVKGLAALLCELYDGGAVDDIINTEPTLIDALGIGRQLSPTRANGLTNVRHTIRELAAKPSHS